MESRRRIVIVCLFVLFSQLCFAIQPNLLKNTNAARMEQWVDSVFRTMTFDEKIGQLFVVIADPGSDYHTRISRNIENQKVGGVLFSKGTLADQVESINLYQKRSRIPLFITFDGEWGLAMRLEGTPQFPKNMMLGAIQDNDLLRQYGEEMARQCRELGVQINFAPVLDVNINPANPVIGSRSFGSDPRLVAEKAIAYARGLESGKVLSVGKHFPGHGDTSEDSHKTLPKITHNRERLERIELYPFVQFINAGLGGIMSGHLSVPALDSQSGLPTSLSPVIVTELLHKQMGFEGLTFTDALVMEGARAGKHSICVEALLAGNDILLSPASPVSEFNAVKAAVEQGVLSRNLIEERCKKVLRYKYILGLNNYKPIETRGLKQRLHTEKTDWLIRKLNNEGITLLKNNGAVVPVKGLGGKKIAVVSLGADKKTDFQTHSAQYGGFDHFHYSTKSLAASQQEMQRKLAEYDIIICGVHHHNAQQVTSLQTLAKTKEVHLCLFMSPYYIKRFSGLIGAVASVTLAYENTPAAQQAGAEVLWGGVPAKGKLPVTLTGLFDAGHGLTTEKTRLAYDSPYEVGFPLQGIERIESIIREGIQEKAYPGCQVLIARKGIVFFNKSFGFFDYTNTRRVENTHIYDLASVTKAAATVPAIMKLYDDKQISLTSKLSDFIPEFRKGDKQGMTIRSALLHETGLPAFIPFYRYIIDDNSYSGRLYANRQSDTYNIPYDTNVFMRSDFRFKKSKVSDTLKDGFSRKMAENMYIHDGFEDEIIDSIANTNLRRPGSYLYSDLNFILLKRVVDNITKEPFDEYLNSVFFSNLGANYTDFLPINKMDKENIVPTEHDKFLREQIVVGFPHDEAAALLGGVSGHAGLFSNTNDLAKLLQMFLNGGKYGGEQFLSKSTIDAFTQKGSASSRRGLGFDKPDPAPGKGQTCDAAPQSVYGHTGFTGTCFWVDPQNELIYVFLSNRVYPSRMQTKLTQLKIRSRIQEVIYESIAN